MPECESRKIDRRSLLLVPGAALLARTGHVPNADEPPPALPLVPHPCSLRKVCAERSRRFHARIIAEGLLADQRVVWSIRGETPVESAVDRLACLTGSRVLRQTSAGGRPVLTLERLDRTARLEAAWRRESLLRTIRGLLKASEQYEQGNRDLPAFPQSVRTYVQLGRGTEARLLNQIAPPDMDRLLHGEEVRLAGGAVTDRQIDEIVAERFAHRPTEDETAADVQRFVERELATARRDGLALRIDFQRKGPRFHLMLWLGQAGRAGGNVLCGFDDESLGLPLTRTNPYDLIEAGGAPPAAPELPAFLAQPLAEDLAFPADGRAEAAALELARIAHVELASDAFLCRAASKLRLHHNEDAARELHQLGQEEAATKARNRPVPESLRVDRVLAPRGISVAEALDRLCRRFGYLWWEERGVVYLRARAWVWDRDYEAPDAFLGRWSAAAARRRLPEREEIMALAALTPLQLNGLGALGGRIFLTNSPDREEFQEFFTFFRSRSPAEQNGILGPGLPIPVNHSDTFKNLFSPFSNAPLHPIVLRLVCTAREDASVTPAVTRVNCQLRRDWPTDGMQSEFSIDVPPMVDPFVH